MNKILIAIPVRDTKEISSAWNDWMGLIYRNIVDEGLEVIVETVVGEFYDTARNKLVDYAIENKFTHIFFIDDDIFIPMRGLQVLLESNKDVISFPAYAKEVPLKSNVFPNFYFFSIPKLPKNKVMKVDWVGTGCMLIRTSVFDKLEKPYFGAGVEVKDNLKGTKVSYKTSEDEFFCRKLRDVNVDVYVNTYDICEHLCRKQELFFPSLNKLEPDGSVVYGGFFDVWLKEDEGEMKNE